MDIQHHLDAVEALVATADKEKDSPRTLGVLDGKIVIHHEKELPWKFHKITKLSPLDLRDGLSSYLWGYVTAKIKVFIEKGYLK